MTKQDPLVDIAYCLLALGVSGARIAELMNTYPPDLIAKQLDYLPYRNALRPEAMIIEAIRKNYSAPKDFYAPHQTHSSGNRRSMDKGSKLPGRHTPADPQGHGASPSPHSPSPIDGLAATEPGIDLVIPPPHPEDRTEK